MFWYFISRFLAYRLGEFHWRKCMGKTMETKRSRERATTMKVPDDDQFNNLF